MASSQQQRINSQRDINGEGQDQYQDMDEEQNYSENPQQQLYNQHDNGQYNSKGNSNKNDFSQQQQQVQSQQAKLSQAKQMLVNRLFQKVQVGNLNQIVRYRGNSQDTSMTPKIVIDNWKQQQLGNPKPKDILPPIVKGGAQTTKGNNQDDGNNLSMTINELVRPTSKQISKIFRLQALGSKRGNSIGQKNNLNNSSNNIPANLQPPLSNNTNNLYDNSFSLMLPPSRNIISRDKNKKRMISGQNQTMIDQTSFNQIEEMQDNYQQDGSFYGGAPLNVSYKIKPVKILMDEMIGTNNTSLEYYHTQQMKKVFQSQGSKSILKDDDTIGPDQSQYNADSSGNQIEKGLYKQASDTNIIENNGEAFQSRDIDSFIQAVRESKVPLSQFIYLVKIQQNSNDAYNMKVVKYHELKKNNINDYYTLSSQGVTRFENNKPSDFVHLSDWLKERDQFNEIKSLKFFQKFRKWKTLKKWCKIIYQQRHKQLGDILNEKLFILKPIYQKLLLNHRALCYDIEKLRFVDVQGSDTLTLQEFQDLQQNQRSDVASKLETFSQKLHDNCRKGIKEEIDQLRLKILKAKSNEEEQMREQAHEVSIKNQVMDEKKQIWESLGFPQDMNYGQRSMMRNEFVRFLRLAYLLDFVAIQSLGNVYINSATDFLSKIKETADCATQNKILESDPDKLYQEFDPMFKIDFKLKYDLKNINQNLVVQTQQYRAVNLKNSLDDFDLEKFSEFTKEITNEDDQQQQQQENKTTLQVEEELDDDDLKMKREAVNIHTSWLQVLPSRKEFLDTIQHIFSEGLDCIQNIERWSKHQQFLIYVKGLEEWDEIIGEKWAKPESYSLNPTTWIKESMQQNSFMEDCFKVIESSFKRIEKFQEEFKPYFNMFWREINCNINILENPRLLRQQKTFSLALKCYQDNTEIFNVKFIQQANLGLFKAITTDLAKQIIPDHTKRVHELETVLLKIYRERSQKVRQWLEQAQGALSGGVTEIEQFVERKNALDRIYREQSGKKDELMNLDLLLGLLKSKQVQELQKADTDLLLKLNDLDSKLNTALNNAETQTTQDIDKQKLKLQDKIKILKEKAVELLEESQNKKYLEMTVDQKLRETYVKELVDIDCRIKMQEDNMNKYIQYEEILAVQETANYETLLSSREQLNLRLSMWKGILEFDALQKDWENLPFASINAKQIASQTEQYIRIVNRCKKNLPENKVIDHLMNMVWKYKDTMPVVTALRSEYLTEDHWRDIKAILKSDFSIEDADFTLKKLLALQVDKHQEDIMEISVRAAQEESLRQQIDQVEKRWEEVELHLKQYKDSNDLWVLADVDELIQEFDESLATINNILASRYVRPLRTRAEKMQQNLLLLSDIVDKWVEYQRKWMYLENIFSAPDIKKNLPQESHQFDVCDKFLRQLMKKTSMNRKIIKLIKWPGTTLNENLGKNCEALDVIERQLEDYLELKRQSFPRFYFLSNDELLEILAKASKLEEVEPHLGKCFEGLVKLYMGHDKTTSNSNLIYGMISPEGEVVEFSKYVQAKSNVEVWLDYLQKEMFDCIKKKMREGLQEYMEGKKKRNEWILTNKGQVVATISQILWCLNTQDYLIYDPNNTEKGNMWEWYEVCVGQLQQLTALVRGDLSSLHRKIIVALITTDVHNRDIVERLANLSIESVTDFNWQQQLRYYWDERQDDCVINQVTAKIIYGYEYLGATSRLVITPLTDRCWITITSALENKLGAAPAGPAGTGKTESTKDLAKSLGRLCIVFNCSDQITAAMMNKLYSGLVQQGAWACLDEFNRIDIEVLSVIAQQLLTIRIALLAEKEKFEFEGIEIPLKNTYGVFITMNPGYAGRTELPDNLKSLFRPVSMMIPDYAMIAEIMLFAEGFENAQTLSKKMVQLYKLSSEQLSQQDHYDFGMRAVKSLLVMAGSLKRAESKLSEDIVLIRAMRDSNVPKFLKDDLPLFSALVQDLFPGAEIPEVQYGNLEFVINQSLKSSGLQVVDTFVTKIIQLFDTMNVRFGVMLVGPTGSGKTECYKNLAKTMSTLRKQNDPDQRYQYVDYHVLNPKCITMGELYGEVDIFTQEWMDGLASSIIRNVNTPGLDSTWDSRHRDWIVFDGPVDALWIENMNTVLDDNMTLCLANSERIKLRQELRMVFEVQDLAVASPATVSRCGMVYLCHEDLGWMPYVKTWTQNFINTTNKEEASNQGKIYMTKNCLDGLINMFNNTFDQTSIFTRNFYEPFPTIQIQQANNMCNILQVLLKTLITSDSDEEILKRINYMYVFSLIWGVCGSVSQKHYDTLDIYFKDTFQQLRFPKCETIFDFTVETNTQKNFVPWEVKPEDFAYSRDTPYFNLLVPTVDTKKITHILEKLIYISKPCLFTGDTGVGKSVIVQNFLSNAKNKDSRSDKATINGIFLNFSAQTNPKQTQLAIESKLNKKGKTLFGARPNERIAIFIDDVNMPALESYGAQPCIELLRQLADKGGFYDRQKLFWKNIEDTTLICAGAPPGGGRNPLTPRFVRHFNVFCLPQPSNSTMEQIFGSIMKGFTSSYNFSEGVKKSHEAVVKSTIDIYNIICKDLLPIPSKFHYIFNLRDVSKVFQGILQVRPQSVNSLESLTKLWIHETSRVFADRLVNDEDRGWFKSQITSMVSRYFNLSWSQEEIFTVPFLFSDILKLDLGQNIYEEITDRPKVIKNLEEKLEDYNLSSNDKMNLVFFDDAMEHIVRISRILRQPRGNAMLIGVGGSGKQSLSKLSSFGMKCEVFQIELVKNYNSQSFREDLMKIMNRSGVEGIPTSFIFTDVQISSESFLEDINNLLNTGEVPNLYAKKEDLDNIINNIRTVAVKLKRPDSPESLWSFFVERVRENLHIILCMSPVGEALRVRCRKFPSLVNCCTLDWFPPWPKEALLSVAQRFLSQVELPSLNIRDSLTEMCMRVSVDVSQQCDLFYKELRRRIYTTPKSYLDQIKLYCKLLTKKREEMLSVKKKLSDGLEKLQTTNDIVAQLKIEMEALQPQLEEQQIKTDQFIQQLSIDSAEAGEKELAVSIEAEKVNEQAQEIKVISDEAQTELNKALPELQKAEEALKSINRSDIDQVRTYKKPPELVQMVLECVLCLFGEKNDWERAQKVLQDNFIERLQKYDKDSIVEKNLNKARVYFKKPEWDLTNIQKASSACKSIAMWCNAMDNYSKVAKNVNPLKEKVRDLQSKLDIKNNELKLKMNELQKVKDKVQKLQEECDKTAQIKRQLEEELERTKNRLIAAEKLQDLLADEGVRWKNQIATIDVTIQQLIGSVFLASASINYLGGFISKYRDPMIKQWVEGMQELGVPMPEIYSLADTLETPITIRDWNLQGLPNDVFSVDNGVITKQSERWPLMIDPQGEANKWIKNHERDNNLKIVRFSESHFLSVIQGAISSGYPVLIENVGERLEPSIDSVLHQQTFEVDGRKLIRVGDKKIDYDNRFKMYVTTKMANPHYLPEIFIKVTVINFSITFQGLQDQLLGDVMKNEKPEIEKQRDETVVSIATAKKTIKEAQDKILELLANSKGMILDDVELIETLEKSKKQSAVIAKDLVAAQSIEEQINISRSQYVPVAIRGTVLYFVISDLSGIDPMYQYSLAYFKKLFKIALETSQQSNVLEERLLNLSENITKTVFMDICRGLFNTHKKLFSFLICTAIKRQREEITQNSWNILLRGPALTIKDTSRIPDNPAKGTISERQWITLYECSIQIASFKEIPNLIKKDMASWASFIQSGDIYHEKLPKGCEEIDRFLKLILIKIFRPEKVMHSFSHYVSDELGKFYDEIVTSNMESVYNDSDCFTSIIFILSSGADPTSLLLKLAKQKEIQINQISLGQGQGKKAEILIEKAKNQGTWVLLQNCHLAKSWMGSLEKIVEAFPTPNFIQNDQFRLFLTSMPVNYFPVSVLQNGLKLTTEAPRGLKANLKRSYQEFNQEFLDSCQYKPIQWNRLLFGLSFFHAIVQERRKFGPLGFNKAYEFNDSDLDISTLTLKMFLNEPIDEIPWEAMLYMTGHINYGGRVTDDWDRTCLLSILKKYYNEEILKDQCKLSGSGIYYVPLTDQVEQIRNYIENLPNFDDPEVFGMHENANITFNSQESVKMIETVISIQPRVSTSGGTGKSQDEIVMDLAKDLESRLPALLDKNTGNAELFKKIDAGSLPSLTTVLLQEIEKFNRLLGVCKDSLINLQKAIKGFVVMSQELDDMYLSFLNNFLPPIWKKVSYSSLKPLSSWFIDLIERVNMMKKWLEVGNPVSYWLSGFYFPQGFLTGVLQTHSRKYKIPIDSLSFKYKIMNIDYDKILAGPKDGVYIYGLYLDGARWDTPMDSLVDQQIGQLYSTMPTIHFNPLENYTQPEDNYSCPVYKTSDRVGVLSTTGQSTNFIIAVSLNTKHEAPEFWTLRGTALLCQLND
ncbi:hypothetical protein ABPG72_009081 [Tetrahymena utriculariae]